MGEGVVKAIPELFYNPPAYVEPLNRTDPKPTDRIAAPKDIPPSGDEPTQRFRFTALNKEGQEYSWYHDASLRRTALGTYRWATFEPKEGEDHFVIKAQLQPSAPALTLNVSKPGLMDHLTDSGSDLSEKDLAFLSHIVITPETNPEKSTKS